MLWLDPGSCPAYVDTERSRPADPCPALLFRPGEGNCAPSWFDPLMDTDFHHRLVSVASEIEDMLVTIFDVSTTPPIPQRRMAAMRYAVLGGGTRRRPFRVVQTARLLGGEEETALRAGAAIEFIHA